VIGGRGVGDGAGVSVAVGAGVNVGGAEGRTVAIGAEVARKLPSGIMPSAPKIRITLINMKTRMIPSATGSGREIAPRAGTGCSVGTGVAGDAAEGDGGVCDGGMRVGCKKEGR